MSWAARLMRAVLTAVLLVFLVGVFVWGVWRVSP